MQEYFSNKTIEKLKYDLIRENIITFDDLTKAEEISLSGNLHIGQVLIQEKLISEDKLLKFIEKNLHIPYVNLEDYSLDSSCLKFISAEDAKNHKILPLFKIEDVITVAMADPLDLFVLNNLVKSVNLKIEPVVCSERLIVESVNKLYSYSTKLFLSEQKEKFDWKNELNSEIVNELQAEKIIHAIAYQAFSEEVSEIIIENTTEGRKVKFKKDNGFEEKGCLPILLTPLFIHKLKMLSGIDPKTSDIPQLGKFNLIFDKQDTAIVTSTFPTSKGERFVVKLYKSPNCINELSVNAEDCDFIENCLCESGLILIAGPNLSGKSYVAYSLLNSIDKSLKNVMTLESIIKYDLKQVNQSEIKENIGFNFEKAVKFINFQSPDVIYIEEVFSEQDIQYITMLAKSGKTVINEILAATAEDLAVKLNTKEYIEFKQIIKCLIFVENKDRIQIVRKI